MKTAVENLNKNGTETNLMAARSAWKNMRSIWEQCEGFLFGPVKDNDYDPNMDTWPPDYVQIDSLLASNSDLSFANIPNLTLSLRGYHPIEYINLATIAAKQQQALHHEKKRMFQVLLLICKAHAMNYTQVGPPNR